MIFADFLLRETIRQFSFYYLPLVFATLIVGLLLLFYGGFKTIFISKNVALLFLSAYGIIILTSIVGIFIGAFGAGGNLGVNPVVIGYFVEVFILSVALIIQFRQVQKEKLALSNQLAGEQKKSYESMIDGIEKERGRIAGELHDDIGSRLSLIKNSIFSAGSLSQKVGVELEQIIHDLRNLSHELSPPIANVSGLVPLVERLIGEIRKSSGVDIRLQVFDVNESFTPIQIQHIYRMVQEALQNIVKHANASQADVQLFGYEKELVITIDDNGTGFNPSQTQTGIGLNQIRVRAESLGGSFEINSTQGHGCQLVIEVPLRNDQYLFGEHQHG